MLSKVIADLRCCLDEENPDDCRGCSYHGMWGCVGSVMADALELLNGIPRDCHSCRYENSYSGAEPCCSCGSRGDEPPSNWRWKYDS